MNKYSKDVEVRGHLIDSMILTKIFDNIMDLDGKFEVTKIKVGKKRVESARSYLNSISNDRAMPALALRDNKTKIWEPVGEENLYAVVDESSGFVLTDSSGYILAICDKNGISKTLVQGLSQEQKDEVVNLLKKDNIPEYKGKVALPV